jgi:hypothetical protein
MIGDWAEVICVKKEATQLLTKYANNNEYSELFKCQPRRQE